ncbi:MAG: hypothetical protein MRQ09_03355 [Candidatus Midichloria sp.]|nr:hypothetical protein [Candidatus Midichloria sp.]
MNKPLLQRLNDQKKGAIIVVMQRLHVKDLTGFLLEKDPHNWQLLSLPLIAERDEVVTHHNFSYKRKVGEYLHSNRDGEIESLKKALGIYAFSAQYQQNPIQIEGGYYQE